MNLAALASLTVMFWLMSEEMSFLLAGSARAFRTLENYSGPGFRWR